VSKLDRWVVLISVAVIAACAGCNPSAGTSPATEAPAPTVSSAPTPSPSTASAIASASASTSPAAEATVPTDWTTYSSTRYAYTVDYPTDWIATPASQDWPATGFSFPDDPAIDKWVKPAAGSDWVLMFVSSVPLKDGEDAKERIARLDADNASVCQLSNQQKVTLDGAPARQEEGMCFGSDYIREVAAVHDGRFYLEYVLSGSPMSETTQATFDHFLASFHFGAGGA
jgi:hypothetical protein